MARSRAVLNASSTLISRSAVRSPGRSADRHSSSLAFASAVGNQEMQSLLKSKPAVDGRPLRSRTRLLAENSPAEQEADEISRNIDKSAGVPAIKQRSSSPYRPTPELSERLQQLNHGGKPLGESDRGYFEQRFGRDLSGVQIHDDAENTKLTRGIGAQAFTFGNHIVMDTQQGPQDLPRRTLLAHELTHVAQQCSARWHDSHSGGGKTETPHIAAKVTVTEKMWRDRLNIELRKYRQALEGVDIAVRRWSLQQAIKETNTHLGTAKGTFEPPQEIIDKVEGVKTEPESNTLAGKIGNYVDTFDSWDYDVNFDIVKTSGSEWTGASPWLALHFGSTTINVDMRQIQDRTLSFEEIKAAFEKRYVRQGITFPAVMSLSTCANVVAAMEAAREERDAAFGFTNVLAVAGVAAFFMTWPGIAPAGPPGGGGLKPPARTARPGAWTQRAARLKAIRQTRVAIQPFRETAQKLAQEATKGSGKVVVNIGGTAAKGEPATAINLNPNLEGMERKNIPNLVETYGEYIGSLFKPQQVDEIVSQGLSPRAINWPRVISGSGEVLKSGGKITIKFRWADKPMAQQIAKLMGQEGFESIQIIGDAVITAVKK